MKKFKGICPITNKVESVYCSTIDCGTQDNPNDYILGLMYACSVDPRGYNLCEECPINPLNNKNNKV